MIQSCRAYSNHAKQAYRVVKQLNDAQEQNGQHATFSPPRNQQWTAFNFKTIRTSSDFSQLSKMFYHLQTTPANALTEYKKQVDYELIPLQREETPKRKDNSDDTMNLHLGKMKKQFLRTFEVANSKMSELQSELGKMQRISYEFDVLAKFLSSDEKLSGFERDVTRMRKKVRQIEKNVNDLSANNQQVVNVIKGLSESGEQHRAFHNKSIENISVRLSRLEVKLNALAKQMPEQNKQYMSNMSNDYCQFKTDMEHILDERMQEVMFKIENNSVRITPRSLVLIVFLVAVVKALLVGQFFDKFLCHIQSAVLMKLGYPYKESKKTV